MDTVWFGIKLAIGLALGFAILFLIYQEIRGFLYVTRFTRAGCTYQKGEKPGTPSGWITRDPRTDDWLLWDDTHNVCLRMADYDPLLLHWGKEKRQAWAASRGIPNDATLEERVAKDASQWNLSNYSLEQFLTLACEYEDYWKKK